LDLLKIEEDSESPINIKTIITDQHDDIFEFSWNTDYYKPRAIKNSQTLKFNEFINNPYFASGIADLPLHDVGEAYLSC
jgi:hypothetical protein